MTINTAKVKTITLSLSEEGGEVTVNANFSVDSTEDATWEDDDLTLDGNVTEVEEPAFALISAEQGNFANVTLNTNQTGKDKLAAGWGTVIATSTVKNDDETETKVPNAVIAIEEDAATGSEGLRHEGRFQRMEGRWHASGEVSFPGLPINPRVS